MESLIISYIVPVYNTAEYLPRCVDSIEQQGLSPDSFEVIMVDDGSTDNSLAVMRKLAEKYGNIVVVTQENKGVSVARNKGMDLAKGKYIAFVDSDDALAQNSLGAIINIAEKKQLQILLFSGYIHHVSGTKAVLGSAISSDTVITGEQAIIGGIHFSSIWNAIYLRSFLVASKVRFMEGVSSGEDVDFCMRLYPQASRVEKTDALVYNYYQRQGSLITGNDIESKKDKSFSCLKMACGLLAFASQQLKNDKVRQIYSRQMNSLLVAQYIDILRNRKQYGKPFIRKYIDHARQNGGLPVHGRTESWKSTLAELIVNSRILQWWLCR